MTTATKSGFLRISCSKCGGYLGDVDVTRATVVQHHCKTCNRNVQHEVNGFDTVVRSYTKQSIQYIDSIAVVEA
jgi:ribosomal protein L44E